MKILFILLALCTCITINAQTVIEKYPNGKIKSEVTYKDSLKDGTCRYYFESGKPQVMLQYSKGNLVGTMKEFYESGDLAAEIDTKTLKAKIYHEGGSYCYKGTYENHNFVMNGIWEDWYIKGNYKQFACTFVDGYKTGPYTAYRKNGTIEATGHYIKGIITDTFKLYSEKGVLEEMQVWKPDSSGHGSNLVNTIYLTDKKSDGTPEMIDGKLFIWKNGKLVELKD